MYRYSIVCNVQLISAFHDVATLTLDGLENYVLSSASHASLSKGWSARRRILTLFPDCSRRAELDRCSTAMFRAWWGSGSSQKWCTAKPAGKKSYTVSISIWLGCKNGASQSLYTYIYTHMSQPAAFSPHTVVFHVHNHVILAGDQALQKVVNNSTDNLPSLQHYASFLFAWQH